MDVKEHALRIQCDYMQTLRNTCTNMWCVGFDAGWVKPNDNLFNYLLFEVRGMKDMPFMSV